MQRGSAHGPGAMTGRPGDEVASGRHRSRSRSTPSWTRAALAAVGSTVVLVVLSLGGPAGASGALTSSTLSSSVDPSYTNQPVTISATVATIPPGASPTGTVTFTFSLGNLYCNGGNSATANTVTLTGSLAQCSLSGLSTEDSPLTVNAMYSGDGTDQSSTALPFTQNIGTLSGQPVHFYASVATTAAPNTTMGISTALPASTTYVPPITGNVSWLIMGTGGGLAFCEQGGSTGLNANREISECTVPRGELVATYSPWTVQASYNGDPNYGSTSALPLTQYVLPVTSRIHIAGSPIPPVPGASVAFTASVLPSGDGATPTGSISFAFNAPSGAPAITCQGGSNTVTMGAGVGWATCSLPSGLTTGGTYIVQATYSGDASNAASATCAIANMMSNPPTCSGTPRSLKFRVR
jgi:Bacterial Ig-like domain (group 3)